ncbi:MAG: proprotein convertase P-domain-containing protein, partial [Chloroflexaceae bacterium]|nr:proprotein convertase P-domain-containing protein [Chloroflexaceae bacterium]
GGLGTIHVYCNPWGPSDSRPTLAGPGPLMRAALQAGTSQGRGGLGSVILWASGNGRGSLDNANYDGYANSRYVIAVGACDNRGLPTPYAEPGACVFVCTPSEGGPGPNSQITTTDRTGALGRNTDPVNGDYFNSFGGTSASVGMAAGVAALVLEANPSLGWRDVKHLFALTSTRIASTNAGWVTNAAGYAHHDTFGFGLLNTAAAASLAQTWTNVPAEVELNTGTLPVNQPILDGTGLALTNPVFGPPVTSSVTVPFPLVLETVSVSFNATHTYRGDVEVVLTSPSGVESVLAGIRNDSGDHYTNWGFTTVKNWGEFAAGTWTLRVRDGITNDSGHFNHWALTFHGTPVAVPPLITHLAPAPGGQWQLTFHSQPGLKYQVFHTAELTTPIWTAVGPPTMATAARTTVLVSAPALPRGFFRVAPVH